MSKYDPPAGYVRPDQQNQRHEIARVRQFVIELEHHLATMHERLIHFGRNVSTAEDSVKYGQLMLEMNQKRVSLESYRNTLVELTAMADGASGFGKTLSEQCKREIFHLYATGRYTQEQLAWQYGTTQGTVCKVVNGPSPESISSVNPQGIAGR